MNKLRLLFRLENIDIGDGDAHWRPSQISLSDEIGTSINQRIGT